MTVDLGRHDAVLLVDVQVDFLPGGNLAVRRGNEVVPVLNRYLGLARSKELPVFASRDWHPRDHCSFRPQGGPWPAHCVAGTPGAAFAFAEACPQNVVLLIDTYDTEVAARKVVELAPALRSLAGQVDRAERG